jgi:hypothetical protein
LQRRRPLRKGGARQQSQRNHLTEANAFEHDLAAGWEIIRANREYVLLALKRRLRILLPSSFPSSGLPDVGDVHGGKDTRGPGPAKFQGRICPRGGFELDFASKKIHK